MYSIKEKAKENFKKKPKRKPQQSSNLPARLRSQGLVLLVLLPLHSKAFSVLACSGYPHQTLLSVRNKTLMSTLTTTVTVIYSETQMCQHSSTVVKSWCLYLYYIKSKIIADSLIIFLCKEIKPLPYYIVSNCYKGTVL